ncbi:MAG: Serine/threonine protein phosphatase [uncultured Sulfurovum sp.]|uniref:Serine/threonine protein phosphatase n=1 Tax=uncultured Sulfurovum sp. TaxID=269237 RepID=A0A6S6SEE5_9BACT|nr:MAG: Serine/threonine protein phosphatase [uncultured Sulfurovum sp.]
MEIKKLENTFVIGDVHGCYHTLMNLVKRLPKDAELIFVGDLCDKGDFSKDVIRFVMDNKYQAIKGNHDDLMVKYLQESLDETSEVQWSYDKRFGGLNTIENYKNARELVNTHVAWLNSLPLYIEIEDYFITHGFALEYYEHRDNPNYELEFLSNRYYKNRPIKTVKHDKINVFGHCVFDEVLEGDNFYGIDTGCAYGDKLTAFQLGTHELIQEPMDSRDSTYEVKMLTLELFDIELHPFDVFSSLLIDESSEYFNYDIISNEILFSLVDKYEEQGKIELMNMLRREQVFEKQAKRILGDQYDFYYTEHYEPKKDLSSKKRNLKYEEFDLNRLIEMSWQDRMTFDTIYEQYGLTNNQLQRKMRKLLSKKAYRRWRKRVSGRKTKHKQKVSHKPSRFEGPW